jgi:hypothetical protein
MSYNDMSAEEQRAFSNDVTLPVPQSRLPSAETTHATSSQPPSSVTSARSPTRQGDCAKPAWQIVRDVKEKILVLRRALKAGIPGIEYASDAGYTGLKSLFYNLEKALEHVRKTPPDEQWHVEIANALESAKDLVAAWGVDGADGGPIARAYWPGILWGMIAIGEHLRR